MLTITIPRQERWDEANQEFINSEETQIKLEHSLVSVSKWEAKHRRSFLSGGPKDAEEIKDYIRCMLLDEEDEPAIERLTKSNINEITAYIQSPMSATYLREDKNSGGSGGDKITSELIYYYMITLGVPFECQYWHLNRLLTLIRVCAAKNRTGKHSRKDMLRSNSAINAARRAKSGSLG